MNTLLLAAAWIAGLYQCPPETNTAAFFRDAPNDVVMTRFVAKDSPVTRAIWRVACPAMRDLFVNGTRVNETALPPFTAYQKRVLEESFDVTSFVKSGENHLKIELGNGWWNLHPIVMWYRYDIRHDLAEQGEPCVRATLDLTYADGSTQSVETGSDWLACEGRLLRNSLYLGVTEDARRQPGEPRPVRLVKGPSGRVLPAGNFPKVIIYDRVVAKSVTPAGPNCWLVDFGVNQAGTYRATLRNVPAGTRLLFRSGERKWPDGTVNVMTAVAGQIKRPERGPLFAIAEQREEWISDGAAESVFEPRMTFHVFRYLQVEGLTSAPRPEDFVQLAWSADVKDAGDFGCSDPRLNNLHAVARRTFRANLQSVQSDCPGREKFGYGGDMACTMESFRCNYAMGDFYRKALNDFLDEAEDDGIFTEVAPYTGIGSTAEWNAFTGSSHHRAAPIGWAVGVPLIADLLLRYEGDCDAVARVYPALVRYIDIVSATFPNDRLPNCLGDWISLDKADEALTTIAHWHQFLSLTAKFAHVLGKHNEAALYQRRAAKVAVDFRARFVHPDGLVGTGKQGEQLFALYHGLLEGKDVPRAYERLKADIRARGNALSTGIFATKYLLEYLPAHGDAELAGQIVTHEGFPGWLYMVEKGATTLWEHWIEEQCLNVYSNCHPMFGTYEEWFTREVLGIRVPDDAVGCDRIVIDPKPVAGLTWAKGFLDTPKGRVSVSWRIVNGQLETTVDVPKGIAIRRP